MGQEGIAVGDGGGRVKQENILNTDLPMHRKTPTPSGVVVSMKSKSENERKRNRGECKVRPRSRNHSPKGHRSPRITHGSHHHAPQRGFAIYAGGSGYSIPHPTHPVQLQAPATRRAHVHVHRSTQHEQRATPRQ